MRVGWRLAAAVVVVGCASSSNVPSADPTGRGRQVEVVVYDLEQVSLPGPSSARGGPGLVIVENARAEHRGPIEATFRESHPQDFDRIADLGLVVRAQGQVLRLEVIEAAGGRSELLLVLETPGDAPSMFHAARRNTELYSETEELLVFDPRLGRVTLSPNAERVFLVYPLQRGALRAPSP